MSDDDRFEPPDSPEEARQRLSPYRAPQPPPPRSDGGDEDEFEPEPDSDEREPGGVQERAAPETEPTRPQETLDAPRPKRGRLALAVAFVVVAGLVFLGGVAGVILLLVGDRDEGDVRIVDEWTDYPGTAWGDPDAALDGASYEAARGDMESLLDQFREQVAERYGVEWNETADGYEEFSPNGYDGESMLRDVAPPSFQGSTVTDDPAAREQIADLFQELAAQHDLEGYLRNELYADDAEVGRRDFGGPTLEEQPLWSTGSYNDDFTVSCGADVLDRSLPVADIFSGDWMFDYELAGDDTLIVTVNCYGYELLSEEDREEFVEALEPYEGQQKPDPR